MCNSFIILCKKNMSECGEIFQNPTVSELIRFIVILHWASDLPDAWRLLNDC